MYGMSANEFGSEMCGLIGICNANFALWTINYDLTIFIAQCGLPGTPDKIIFLDEASTVNLAFFEDLDLEDLDLEDPDYEWEYYINDIIDELGLTF